MKIVAYYRVSTKRQGESGLGLEAQQAAVNLFATQGNHSIVKSFLEVETGKSAKNNPELGKAIAHARRAGAILVIAKLDRLARNPAFTSALMESGVEFKACDNPFADKFTIHILAACAEKECRDISARTKAALAAYKARGGNLGAARQECANNLSLEAAAKGRQLAAATISQEAKEAYTDLLPTIKDLKAKGHTLRQIADYLNAEGYTTRKGKPWRFSLVAKILERQ